MKQFKRTPYFLVSGIFLFLSCQTEEIPFNTTFEISLKQQCPKIE
jgi:hypothetical protein